MATLRPESRGQSFWSPADNTSYSYDNNGNQIGDNSVRTFTYSVFNKPLTIQKDGSHTTHFSYGPDRSRYKRVDSGSNGTTTTLYLGSVEKVHYPDNTIHWKRTVGDVAIINQQFDAQGSLANTETHYLIRDHLGSTALITDGGGAVTHELYSDPWGQPRKPEWDDQQDIYEAVLDQPFLLIYKPVTTRGFTGHEHLDEVGIIHMNGRIYDPALARFMQSDPIIQNPTTTRSLNRYSYVWNNPLNATDPSGFFRDDDDDDEEEDLVKMQRERDDDRDKADEETASRAHEREVDAPEGSSSNSTDNGDKVEGDILVEGRRKDDRGAVRTTRIELTDRATRSVQKEQEGAQEGDSFHPFVPDSVFEDYFLKMDFLQAGIDQLESGVYYRGISGDIGALRSQMSDLTNALACQMDMCGINPVAPELLFVPGAGLARAGWSMKFYRYPNAGGGGLNFYKNNRRAYAVDYHKFTHKGVERARLHYHRGATKNQMKKHRPYEGGL